ncbi:MAG: flagellar biosynthesis protein, partial [Tropicimonas sp.]
MGRPLQLECFDSMDGTDPLLAFYPEARLEEERLVAFDSGYRAGWDDAAAAHADEQGRISAEFAGNLQELSFTYHEARNAVLGEMEGILKGIVDKVLPGTAR